LEWDLKDNESELFHSRADPKETIDLSTNDPQRLLAMKVRIEELLGTPWTAKKDGLLHFKDGVGLQEGLWSNRMKVRTASRFLVLPYDQPIYFQPEGSKDKLGPWMALSPEGLSESSPLELDDHQRIDSVEMNDSSKKLLESLGYMQKEED
jgi:hypothetical protein